MNVLQCRVPDRGAELGRRIATHREAVGVSRQGLADALGWLEAQIEDCENGMFSPSWTDVATMAVVLGVSVDSLRDGREWKAASESAPLSGVPDASAIDLVGAFARISDPRKRSLLMDLAVCLAS